MEIISYEKFKELNKLTPEQLQEQSENTYSEINTLITLYSYIGIDYDLFVKYVSNNYVDYGDPTQIYLAGEQLLYCVCVLHYGEYGTSPMSGWFGDKTKVGLLTKIYCHRLYQEYVEEMNKR